MTRETDKRDRRRDAAAESERWRRIAEAAYYEAERRGFAGNRALDDWLEAEARIDGRCGKSGRAREDADRRAERAESGDSAPTGELPARRPKAAGAPPAVPGGTAIPSRPPLKASRPRLRDAILRIGSTMVGGVKRYLRRDEVRRDSKP